MQKERDEVLILYKSAGLELSKNFREPEDHVAIELQFMCLERVSRGEIVRGSEMPMIRRKSKT